MTLAGDLIVCVMGCGLFRVLAQVAAVWVYFKIWDTNWNVCKCVFKIMEKNVSFFLKESLSLLKLKENHIVWLHGGMFVLRPMLCCSCIVLVESLDWAMATAEKFASCFSLVIPLSSHGGCCCWVIFHAGWSPTLRFLFAVKRTGSGLRCHLNIVPTWL